ncbi:TetR/AcrR family transcriptional regulator [Anaerolentibacter hominis]|uniref:TetR/AcrR family transcriptional regulator n=1 Tax=Anaerolentibacter hominis TaxID=3079009 RepID=UPI0031B89245
MARKKIPENYDKRKNDIIQASIGLMIKKSMADFSLASVAEATGLTKAAIYWYFPNKNTLIEETVKSVYQAYIGNADKIAASGLSAYEKLRLIILGESDTIASAMMCLFPIKFYLEAYSNESPVKNLIRDGYEHFNNLIAGLIASGINNGEFLTDLPVKQLTTFITAAIDGLAFQNLLVSSEHIEYPREFIVSAMDRILRPVTEKEV